MVNPKVTTLTVSIYSRNREVTIQSRVIVPSAPIRKCNSRVVSRLTLKLAEANTYD